ncbi:MAG: hypothetical protein A3K19_04665 [Lentisphaerae bacterium RIFOXYB12_FULL_65_16]|nr:MAG: hypothetical protein A3K19_04665 [Lentisphaerae bacterium RIFOXYB12_FULL_65_16]
MAEKVDKSIVQMNIRREVGYTLDKLLGEDLYRHCFITGDDAWSFRYNYAPTATFPDETVYSGHVVAKGKKKYARFVQEKEHRFAFCVRVRGRYDMDVQLNRIGEGEF